MLFINTTAPTAISTLSLHDALPICPPSKPPSTSSLTPPMRTHSSPSSCLSGTKRSEEHTSELQSRRDLVCRLLLEKKKSSQCQQRTRPRLPHENTSSAYCTRRTDFP